MAWPFSLNVLVMTFATETPYSVVSWTIATLGASEASLLTEAEGSAVHMDAAQRRAHQR